VLPFCAVAWEICIDPARRVTHLRLRGRVTFDDLQDAHRALGSDAAFDPRFPIVIDLQAAREVDLTHAELDAIVARCPVDAGSRRAIVVGNLIVSAIARVYQFMRQDMTRTPVVRICGSLDEAWSWLRVEPLGS
jgi:hypothetical protein